MTDRLDHQFRIQRAALEVLSQRQELLASNIANADTPHYKARDIDFKEALATAVAARPGAAIRLAVTARGHIGGGAEAKYAGAVKYRNEFQPSVDGNTVNMDVERAAFAENALRLEAALSFINGAFKTQQQALAQ